MDTVQSNSVSIILPAHNEAENIGPLIREIHDYFHQKKIVHEIILVNDGSTDNTAATAHNIARELPVLKIVNHKHLEGYGKTLRDGFSEANCQYLFYTDSDRQFSIKDFDAFLPFIDNEREKVVTGYRIDRMDPSSRKMLSRVYNAIVNSLLSLDIKDVNCAFKLLNTSLYHKLNIRSTGPLINAEIIAKCRLSHISVEEIGVRHYPRTSGSSTVNGSMALRSLFELGALYIETAEFKKIK